MDQSEQHQCPPTYSDNDSFLNYTAENHAADWDHQKQGDSQQIKASYSDDEPSAVISLNNNIQQQQLEEHYHQLLNGFADHLELTDLQVIEESSNSSEEKERNPQRQFSLKNELLLMGDLEEIEEVTGPDAAAYSTIQRDEEDFCEERQSFGHDEKSPYHDDHDELGQSSMNRGLNSDMYNLLIDTRFQGDANGNQQQFFYSEDIIDEEQDNNEEFEHRQLLNEQEEQQFQNEQDNYDNIGKWEEQNKENEINEIESLEFSVKREEFQESQQYQSQPPAANQSAIVSSSTNNNGTESMLIYQSPHKLNASVAHLTKNVKSERKQAKLPAPEDTPQIQTQPNKLQSETLTKQSNTGKQKGIDKVVIKKEEKKNIQKIKDLFYSEEKFQRFERLHSQDTLSSQRKRKNYMGEYQDDTIGSANIKECTFRPKIDPISSMISSHIDITQISQRTADPCLFLYQRGMTLKERQEKERESLKEMQDKQELKECTFKPNSARTANTSISRLSQQSVNKIFERNKQWDEQRKHKLRQELEKNKVAEMQDCSFTPNIRNIQRNRGESTGRKSARKPLLSQISGFESQRTKEHASIERTTLDIDKSSILRRSKIDPKVVDITQDKSVKLFIERQVKAKLLKHQKEEAFNKHNGSKWSNAITKPNPPKITDIIISNLQKRLDQSTTANNEEALKINNHHFEIKNKFQIESNREPIYDKNNQAKKHFNLRQQYDTLKPGDFKVAVNFLRNALHSLDLD